MKKYFSLVFVAVLVLGAGCATVQNENKPVEVKPADVQTGTSTSTSVTAEIQKNDQKISEPQNKVSLKDWVGEWEYLRSKDGYEDSLSFNFKENNQKLAGTFMGVWSFPTAPAARLNDGVIEIISGTANTLNVKWEGSRNDTGTAALTLSKDKKTITWVGKLDSGVFDDGYHLGGTFTFKKN